MDQSTAKRTSEPLFSEFPATSTLEWMQIVEKDLKGADFDKKLLWKTYEGLSIKPFYRREDLIGLEWLRDNLVGEAPYLRGKKIDNRWEIRQTIFNSDLKEANHLALRSLERGATGIAFKTQILSNHKIQGQNIQSAQDFSQLVHGIWLNAVPLHFEWDNQSPIAWELLIQEAKKQGIELHELQGSFGFDPIAHLAQTGSGPSRENLEQSVVDFIKQVASQTPQLKALTIQSQAYHNAGAHLVQEIAIALATGVEYLLMAQKRGLEPSDVLALMTFSFEVDSQYFLEMAKFRVFRILWSAVLERFGIVDGMSSIHAQTSQRNATIFDPNVNMLRGTTEAMSAILGGVDSFTVQPYDIAFRESNEFSYRIARNTQLLLQHESHFDQVADPSAGSWYIEKITESMAEQAWQLFLNIEEQGGILQSLQSGWIQNEIALISKQRQKNISMRKDVLLGTNTYPNLGEDILGEIQAHQQHEIPSNSIFSSAKSEVEVQIKALDTYRGAAIFEQIRLDTERFVQNGGTKPLVYLWQHGNLTMRKARATFALNFLGCAGYKIIENAPLQTESEILSEISQNRPQIVVLCSSDDEYSAFVPHAHTQLQTINSSAIVLLAGAPGDKEAEYRAAGVQDFIHLRVSAGDFLQAFQNKLGVTA